MNPISPINQQDAPFVSTPPSINSIGRDYLPKFSSCEEPSLVMELWKDFENQLSKIDQKNFDEKTIEELKLKLSVKALSFWLHDKQFLLLQELLNQLDVGAYDMVSIVSELCRLVKPENLSEQNRQILFKQPLKLCTSVMNTFNSTASTISSIVRGTKKLFSSPFLQKDSELLNLMGQSENFFSKIIIRVLTKRLHIDSEILSEHMNTLVWLFEYILDNGSSDVISDAIEENFMFLIEDIYSNLRDQYDRKAKPSLIINLINRDKLDKNKQRLYWRVTTKCLELEKAYPVTLGKPPAHLLVLKICEKLSAFFSSGPINRPQIEDKQLEILLEQTKKCKSLTSHLDLIKKLFKEIRSIIQEEKKNAPKLKVEKPKASSSNSIVQLSRAPKPVVEPLAESSSPSVPVIEKKKKKTAPSLPQETEILPKVEIDYRKFTDNELEELLKNERDEKIGEIFSEVKTRIVQKTEKERNKYCKKLIELFLDKNLFDPCIELLKKISDKKEQQNIAKAAIRKAITLKNRRKALLIRDIIEDERWKERRTNEINLTIPSPRQAYKQDGRRNTLLNPLSLIPSTSEGLTASGIPLDQLQLRPTAPPLERLRLIRQNSFGHNPLMHQERINAYKPEAKKLIGERGIDYRLVASILSELGLVDIEDTTGDHMKWSTPNLQKVFRIIVNRSIHTDALAEEIIAQALLLKKEIEPEWEKFRKN